MIGRRLLPLAAMLLMVLPISRSFGAGTQAGDAVWRLPANFYPHRAHIVVWAPTNHNVHRTFGPFHRHTYRQLGRVHHRGWVQVASMTSAASSAMPKRGKTARRRVAVMLNWAYAVSYYPGPRQARRAVADFRSRAGALRGAGEFGYSIQSIQGRRRAMVAAFGSGTIVVEHYCGLVGAGSRTSIALLERYCRSQQRALSAILLTSRGQAPGAPTATAQPPATLPSPSTPGSSPTPTPVALGPTVTALPLPSVESSPSPLPTAPEGQMATPTDTAVPVPTPMPTSIPTPSPTAVPAPSPTPTSAIPAFRANVVYCAVDGVDLLMDVYSPQPAGGNMPLVIYVHGGGLENGDKADLPSFVQTGISELNSQGFVVASINYRLAPAYKWPAMIEDVKCAVRYFRASAAEYGIDPMRIGAWGGSAGGQLATDLGTTDKSAGWDVGPYLQEPSRVEAVVDDYGATDLTTMPQTPDNQADALAVFGTTDPAVLLKASAVDYVTPDDSPTLLQHGDKDDEVPLSQSQELYNDLSGVGVYARLQVVQNAGHDFVPVPAGAVINPSLVQIDQQIIDVFTSQLKDNPNPQPQ